MSDFDRDLANFVVNGSEMPVMLRPPEEDLPDNFPGNNLFSDSNVQNSSVSGNVYGSSSCSIPLQNLSNQPTVPQRKRVGAENVLELDSVICDNNRTYGASGPPPPFGTPRQGSAIPLKAPRLNHMSAVPTATNSTSVQLTLAGGTQGMGSVSTQSFSQSNMPSYQVEAPRYQQSNNGLITANNFQGVNLNGVGGNLSQATVALQTFAVPQRQGGINRSSTYTEELMVDLVDDMITDPKLHITKDFQKQDDFKTQKNSFDNQVQFKSAGYPILETKIKQEAISPTASEASFFGNCISQGNFCQAPTNSMRTRYNTTDPAANTNFQQYQPVQQPQIHTRVNQPINNTLLQNICPQSSTVFPNKNSLDGNFNFTSQPGVSNSIQNREFVSSQMKQQAQQLKLRNLLEQDNANYQASFNDTQQQSFNPNAQQNYTFQPTQNSATQRNAVHQAGFSVQNNLTTPGSYTGQQANSFQQLNNSSIPSVKKTRQNINFLT